MGMDQEADARTDGEGRLARCGCFAAVRGDGPKQEIVKGEDGLANGAGK